LLEEFKVGDKHDIKEGEEPEEFWGLLGGKADYA